MITSDLELGLTARIISDTPQYMQVAGDKVFVGTQNSFSVFDRQKFENRQLDKMGTGPSKPLEDHDFAYGLGNTILVSSDEYNKNGSAWSYGLISVPIDTVKDSNGPEIVYSVPANGDTDYPTTAAIGINVTDPIDMLHVTNASFYVQKVGSNQKVAGSYSSQMNLLSFLPDSPLDPGSTYEVVVAAGGFEDWVGNSNDQQWRSTFTTAGGVNEAPTAAIDASALTGSAPLSNTFDASSSNDIDGSIASYQWDFGDGHTATGEIVNYAHEVAGTYDVTLTVTDDDGATAQASVQVSVHWPLTARAPRHSISIIYHAGSDHILTVNPDNNSITATVSAEDPAVTFNRSGSYTFTVVVTDNQGGSTNRSIDVEVVATPTVITITP